MSRKILASCLGVLALGALAPPVQAELCTADVVPAATLLLPYFEVSLAEPNGITTLFSIKNASATAALAHVTLWTDQSCPTLDFDVYLTGYDIQTLNVRDIFNGILPRTADDARDPNDTISPQGWGSQDITFPGCGASLPYDNPALAPILIEHLTEIHSGGQSPVYGRCCATDHGDGHVRGYITVDNVNTCSLEFPSAPGYFLDGGLGIASNRNQLLGDYFFVNPEQAFAQGESMVHIEACDTLVVGQGTDECPYVAGDYTFYGRYVGALASDGREPLATMFCGRLLNGGSFSGGTELVVWRDSKTVATTGHTCGFDEPWFPLGQADFVALDEQENCADLCFRGDNVSPPIGGADTCFPLETQRVSLNGPGVPNGGAPINHPFTFGGWLLNLNTTVAGGLFNPTAQAWVVEIHSASGLFSVGYDAAQLDSACDTNGTGGIIWIQ
jgi:hypothetical protein